MDLQSKFEGSLLGLAVADAFGAPFEGVMAIDIYRHCGRVSEHIKKKPDDTLYYTDDTEMMISVCEQFIESGQMDEQLLMKRFAENYHNNRGYGSGCRRLLDTFLEGKDWEKLRDTQLPGGSFGNGAAMRVAPVGLYCHHDIDLLWQQAYLSSIPTHTHPLGIEGAQILAAAVAFAVKDEIESSFDFFNKLRNLSQTEEFQFQLANAAQLSPSDSIGTFGNSLEAHRSVVTALLCFIKHKDSYSDTIASAVALGNDTDTLAAMAGAISGAYLGIDAIPNHLLNELEESSKGKSYIKNLAVKLVERYENTFSE